MVGILTYLGVQGYRYVTLPGYLYGSPKVWRGMPPPIPKKSKCWRLTLTSMGLQGILAVHLEDGDVQRIVCPEPGCGVPLPRKAVRRLLDEQGMQRFDQLQLQKYIDVNPLIKWCAGHFALAICCWQRYMHVTQESSALYF
jgi:hypothetical protein